MPYSSATELRIPAKIVTLIQMYINTTHATAQTDNELDDNFPFGIV